jgi:CBS domain-containing protein
MRYARDAMQEALRLPPDTTIEQLARTLIEQSADGACVVGEEGELLGVVTAMDLVFREAPVHAPAFVTLFELVLPLNTDRTRRELKKVLAQTAGELMTTEVRTARPDTPLTEVAGWMRDEHLSMVPVVGGDTVHGVVSRRSMVQHVLRTVSKRDRQGG